MMTNAMDDTLRKRFEAQLSAPSAPALERARAFLMYYVHDADRDLLKLDAKNSPSAIIDAVEALEDVLAVPQPPGTLYQMVAYEGNRMLDDETDETAAAWLRQLTLQLREWLGRDAPPVRES
jgi:hypothetical protein